jgi:hypothetical protein
MDIKIIPDYAELITALKTAKPTDWVRVPTDELSGSNPDSKRRGIYSAAASAKISLRTRTLGKHIYMRIRTADETK